VSWVGRYAPEDYPGPELETCGLCDECGYYFPELHPQPLDNGHDDLAWLCEECLEGGDPEAEDEDAPTGGAIAGVVIIVATLALLYTLFQIARWWLS
jgi:hypothetical protein